MEPDQSPREQLATNNGYKENIELSSQTRPPSAEPPLPAPHLTAAEYFIVAIYPCALLLASTFYYLSPSPTTNESYFSQKGNLFNIVFVKYGWFWTSVAFLVHLTRLRVSSKSKAALRWVVATICWVIVTQWCFGPPLMDRAFVASGGACEILAQPGAEKMGTGKLVLTSAACKLAGGQWKGGYDLSGHVFLLTHASLFLWAELLPFLKLGQLGSMENGVVFATLAMWWWMLLMTGIYFHTWVEKVKIPQVSLVETMLTFELDPGMGHGNVAVGSSVRMGGEDSTKCSAFFGCSWHLVDCSRRDYVLCNPV
jgi:hypothetical protein